MESNNSIIYILAIIIVLAAAYVFLVQPQDVDPTKEAKDLYFKFLGYEPGEIYTKTYSLVTDGFEKELVISKKDNATKYLKLSTLFYSQEFYYLSNQTIMCIDFNQSKKCAYINDDATLLEYATILERYFVSPESQEYETELSEFLVQNNAMVFSENITDSEINQNPCKLIEYSIDFKKLTIDQLAQIGKTINSPEISLYSNYNNLMCINEDGKQLFENFTYAYMGVPRYSEKTLISDSTSSNFKVPTEFIDVILVKSTYEQVAYEEQEVFTCLFDEDPEGCFKEKGTYTHQLYYCELAGSKSNSCYSIVASSLEDSSICDMISNQSLKDDCYFEVGVKTEELELCNSISDEMKKSQCLELIE